MVVFAIVVARMWLPITNPCGTSTASAENVTPSASVIAYDPRTSSITVGTRYILPRARIRSKGLSNRVDVCPWTKILKNTNYQLKYEVIRSEKGTIITLSYSWKVIALIARFAISCSSHFL